MAEALEVAIRGSGALLAATKLHIPQVRAELVPRRALVEVLAADGSRKMTLVEAPAGYGKTTLLGEWCSSPREARPFAWLSIDEGDNDPVRFWTGVIEALGTVEPGIGHLARRALDTRGVGLTEASVPLLLNDLAALDRALVLVLDDYQVIRDEEVHGSLGFLLDRLPPSLHLTIATRADPPLPLARMRAAGEVTEIRAAELRFDQRQAGELLRRTAGLDLSDRQVARLQERTEGWPAGLYLAALSLRGRDDPGAFIESFAGDDRHIVDYLSSEVFEQQPEELRTFLMRTSVLDRLCGPLCDAVAGTVDSARLLERIERRNVFVVPLDTTRTWYRYHRLFAQLLRHELQLEDPGAAPELHRRARRWYLDEGSIPEAIHHAIAGEDVDAARELIAAHWNDEFNRGRLGTVERWLDAMPRAAIQGDPRLGAARAWLALDRGRLDDAREWIGAAGAALAGPRAGREVAVEADVGVLRAVHGFKVAELDVAGAAAAEVGGLAEPDSFPHTVARLIGGVVRYWQGDLDEAAEILGAAAEAARAGAAGAEVGGLAEPDSFPHTVARLIGGVVRYWQGDLDEAAEILGAAAEAARLAGNDLGRAYALGYVALIAVDERRLDDADRVAAEAIGLSDAPGFAEHFALLAGHLARGRAAELGGRTADAEAAIRRAVELSDRGAGRLEIAAARLALAGVLQLGGDREGARAALGEARDAVRDCAELGTLGPALAAAERGLRPSGGARRSRPAPAEELTDRELAVLRLLASDLSRGEIADALYVSPNTIKTHLRGIYRKLDASERGEAVSRAREHGLI